jgi:hypothetical protein
LLIAALLGATASCAWPPAQSAAPVPAGPPPVAAAPPPLALLPPPPAPAAPAPAVASTVDYVPFPVLVARLINAPPPSGRLTLHNFAFDSARVQAVITSAPDCVVRQGMVVTDFVLPLNSTRVISTPPGADICWRREMTAPAATGTAVGPSWTEWARVYTASGRYLDSRL